MFLYHRLLVKLYQRETLFAVNIDATNFKSIEFLNGVIFNKLIQDMFTSVSTQ